MKFEVIAYPRPSKTTVMLYVPADEILQKNIPLTDFYVIELDGRKLPAVGHIINKNCLMLTLPSKKKVVREIKDQLRRIKEVKIILDPLLPESAEKIWKKKS